MASWGEIQAQELFAKIAEKDLGDALVVCLGESQSPTVHEVFVITKGLFHDDFLMLGSISDSLYIAGSEFSLGYWKLFLDLIILWLETVGGSSNSGAAMFRFLKPDRFLLAVPIVKRE